MHRLVTPRLTSTGAELRFIGLHLCTHSPTLLGGLTGTLPADGLAVGTSENVDSGGRPDLEFVEVRGRAKDSSCISRRK